MTNYQDVLKLKTTAAARSFIATRFNSDPAAAAQSFDAELRQLLQSDLQRARRFVRAAKKCFGALPHEYWARWQAMDARQCQYAGRHQLARQRYLLAAESFRRHRNAEFVAKVERALTEVCMYLGQYDEALISGRRSLRYFVANGKSTEAAQTLTNIGNVYHRMDNNRMALRYYDHARDIFRSERGIPLAIVDYNRANIMLNLNQLREAEALYREVAGVYTSHGMTIAANLAKSSIAYLYLLEDRYPESLKLIEEAVDALRDSDDVRSRLMAQLDLMEIHLRINQYITTITIGEEIIPSFKSRRMRYEEAKARVFLAMAKQALGDYRQAEPELNRAARLFKLESNHLWSGMVRLARGRLCFLEGDYSTAARLAASALRLFYSSKDERRALDARISWIESRLKVLPTKALLREADILLHKGLTHRQRYDLNRVLGEFHSGRKDYATALSYLSRAVASVEKIMSRLYPDELGDFFFADKARGYSLLIECLLKQGRTRNALDASLTRAAVINHRGLATPRLHREVPENLIAEMEQLRSSLNALYQFPSVPGRALPQVRSASAVEKKVWLVEQRIRTHSPPGYTEWPRLREYKNHWQKYLRPHETLVNFVDTEAFIGAFIATSERADLVPLEITRAELRETLRKLSFLFETTILGPRVPPEAEQSIDEKLTLLFEKLLEPLLTRLVNRRAIFILDGIFEQVPFGALRDSLGGFAKDTLDFHTVVNPSDIANDPMALACLHDRRSAVFAIPTSELQSIEQEGRDISGGFENVHLYLGAEATSAALREELTKANGFVHVAAHASHSSENPLFSKLMIGDGPFYPFDLSGIGIKAMLVTLSGCQTALPGFFHGTALSLAKAFYRAGSRYVIASLWPVKDQVARVFMVSFYDALRDCGNVTLAYRRSVDSLHGLTGAPASWGSFVLLGR